MRSDILGKKIGFFFLGMFKEKKKTNKQDHMRL